MSHQCSSALIRCMDFRLESATEEFLKAKNIINDCDIISVAGVTKELIENPEGFVADQIDISKKLHNINTLIIMHHMDCGGYGGHSSFEGLEQEKEFQISEMKKSQNIISTKYPDLKIILVLADIDEENNVATEEIE